MTTSFDTQIFFELFQILSEATSFLCYCFFMRFDKLLFFGEKLFLVKTFITNLNYLTALHDILLVFYHSYLNHFIRFFFKIKLYYNKITLILASRKGYFEIYLKYQYSHIGIIMYYIVQVFADVFKKKKYSDTFNDMYLQYVNYNMISYYLYYPFK